MGETGAATPYRAVRPGNGRILETVKESRDCRFPRTARRFFGVIARWRSIHGESICGVAASLPTRPGVGRTLVIPALQQMIRQPVQRGYSLLRYAVSASK
jgi:hypothetical protein